jgi:hypothetical protein
LTHLRGGAPDLTNAYHAAWLQHGQQRSKHSRKTRWKKVKLRGRSNLPDSHAVPQNPAT